MLNIKLFKEKMEELGLNSAQLADKSGVDRSLISRYLSGDRLSPTINNAEKLAKAMELTSDEAMCIFFNQDVH